MYKMKPNLVWLMAAIIILFYACSQENVAPIPNNTVFLQLLSDYKLFEGNIADLQPAAGIELYELATPLFTDYAEKQRLIHLPASSSMTAQGDGLPDFPEGTLLVKTFYYYYDKKDTAQGKRIVETRLLQKHNGQWNIATYQWNESQTEAHLITTGTNVPVQWKNKKGIIKNISYRIPTNAECASCHRSNNQLIPIGRKLRNLNREVYKIGKQVNQLDYFVSNHLLKPMSASALTKLPEWDNSTFSLEERARAYLDVNCAHCHTASGIASHTNLELGYEIPLKDTKIRKKKENILLRMQSSNAAIKMPKTGTTLPHEEGIELIRQYIESL